MSPPSTADKLKAGAANAYAQAKVPSLRPYPAHMFNIWLELVQDMGLTSRRFAETQPRMHMMLPATLRMKPPGTPQPTRRPRAT